MADIDWSMFVFDPVKAQGGLTGDQYVNRMYDLSARRKAGQQYAAGDYTAAANTVAARGDFATAETLHGAAQKRFANEQDVLQRGSAFLDQAVTAGEDPQATWNTLAPVLKRAGITDATIQQTGASFLANPKGTTAALRALAKKDLKLQEVNGKLYVIDMNTMQKVAEYGDSQGPFRGNDLQAQALNIVLDPKSDPSARRAAEAVLSQGRTVATAGGILSTPGLGTSWLGAPGGGAAPLESAGARTAPAAAAPAPRPVTRRPIATQAAPPMAAPELSLDEMAANMAQTEGKTAEEWKAYLGADPEEGKKIYEKWVWIRGGQAGGAPGASQPIQLPGATFTPFAKAPPEETYGQLVPAIVGGKEVFIRPGNRGGQQIVQGATPLPRATQSRPIPTTVQAKISAVGADLENLTRLNTTFQDRYGGNVFLGDWANTIGRMRGDATGQAQWWQDYDSYINKVRNELFGASLTPGEKAEFLKAVVTPGMDSGEIKKNLTRQVELVQRAVRRQADPYVRTYGAETIDDALGFPLADVQPPPSAVTRSGAGGGTVPPPRGRTIGRFQVEEGP